MKKYITAIFTISILVALLWVVLLPVIKIGTGNDLANPQLETIEAKQVFSLSQNIIRNMSHGDLRELEKNYGSLFKENGVKDIVAFAKANFSTQPDNVQLVGLDQTSRRYSNGKQLHMVKAILQYQFSKKWRCAEVLYSQEPDGMHVQYVRFVDLTDSLQNTNKVDFSNASLLQYLILFITFLVPIIILTAFIVCMRASDLKRKWLWIIFILVGIVLFNFNWSAQAFSIHLGYFQLFGSFYYRVSSYYPLLLSFSIPFGAIIFLIKHSLSRSKKEKRQESNLLDINHEMKN